MFEEIRDLCRVAGFDHPYDLVRHKFIFSDGENEIAGLITGVSTSDDGLPVIEITNKYFAGLKIKFILLLKDARTTQKAILFSRGNSSADRILGKIIISSTLLSL